MGSFSLFSFVKAPVRPLVLCSIVVAFIVTIAFAAWGLHSIGTSRSSTAAVGYVFLPFYSLGVAVATFVLSYSIGYLLRFALELMGLTAAKITSIPWVGAAVLLLLLSAFTVQNRIARHNLLTAARSIPRGTQLIDHALGTRDVELLARLARNPGTSVADLVRIYAACQDQVTLAYPRDYVVFFSLASNPKTPPEILRSLYRCQQTSTRVQVGLNRSTPVEVLAQLAGDRQAMVRTWVTANPNLPTDNLRTLVNDNDRLVREYAQSNLRHREKQSTKSPGPRRP
jgi:hypothetical protein